MYLVETVAQNDENSHRMRAENKGLHKPAEFGNKHDTKSPTSDRFDFRSDLFIIKAAEQAGFATEAILQSKKKKERQQALCFLSFPRDIMGVFSEQV